MQISCAISNSGGPWLGGAWGEGHRFGSQASWIESFEISWFESIASPPSSPAGRP